MHNIRLEVLRRVTAFLLVFFIAGSGFGLSGCSSKKDNQAGTVGSTEVQSTAVADDMASLVYQGEPYVVINDNNPAFNDADNASPALAVFLEEHPFTQSPLHTMKPTSKNAVTLLNTSNLILRIYHTPYFFLTYLSSVIFS